MSLYEVLGVTPGATPEEVRRAYVEAARRHHPDRGGRSRDMQAVNEAWAVLGDPGRRRAYDRGWQGATSGPPSAGDRRAGHGAQRYDVDDDDADAADPDVAADRLADLLDDRPLGRPLRPSLALAPVALFVAALGTGAAAMVLDEPALLGFAVLLFACSMVAVAAVTLLAMRS